MTPHLNSGSGGALILFNALPLSIMNNTETPSANNPSNYQSVKLNNEIWEMDCCDGVVHDTVVAVLAGSV